MNLFLNLKAALAFCRGRKTIDKFLLLRYVPRVIGLRDWRLRGINHEGVQSVKTAERLGLLIIRDSGFFLCGSKRRYLIFFIPFVFLRGAR